MPNSTDPLVRPSCQHCHGYTSDQFPLGQYNSPDVMRGPHGNYLTTSSKCDSCHTVHSAEAGGVALLPAATVAATCEMCHDGTGGFGVYGAIKAQTGRDPATDSSLGSHRIAATNVVPGGSATGGSAMVAFGGGTLTCSDCHSVHGADTVAPFMGERKRTRSWERPDRPTSKLLRRRTTGAATAVDDYGSDWCAGCHAGLHSGNSLVQNHPVDSLAVRPDPFVFRKVASGRNLATGSTVNSPGGRHGASNQYLFGIGNADFLIAFPRTSDQGTHAPICQQCHEDTRDVSNLTATGAVPPTQTELAYTLRSADGLATTDNPQFQNFPHETLNDSMIIETGDDLCLNCHPAN